MARDRADPGGTGESWVKELTMDKTTLEPVTIGGLYEHTDGTVGMYRWIDGQVRRSWVEETWTKASDRKALEVEPPSEDTR